MYQPPLSRKKVHTVGQMGSFSSIPLDEAGYIVRIICIFLYIIWLHVLCKLPFKLSDNNVLYVYMLSTAIVLSCIGSIIGRYLPNIPLLLFVIDSIPIIGFYVSASWHPRYVYGRQLEKTLESIEKGWKLKLSWVLVVIASPMTCITLMIDNYYLKYGSWDVVMGRIPWTRFDSVRMSLTGVSIAIGSALIIVSYQLYMFYVAFSHLRLDHQKQRALRIILTSYLISLTANNIIGIGMILNDVPLTAWITLLNDIGVIVAPLLPVFVKRFPILERLLMKGIDTSSQNQTQISGLSKFNNSLQTSIFVATTPVQAQIPAQSMLKKTSRV